MSAALPPDPPPNDPLGGHDRYLLYQEAVQDPPSEVRFVEQVYTRIRGRRPLSIQEDFSGAASFACEWVRGRPDRTAVAVDIDAEPLSWGMENNVAQLPESARARIRLEQGDVCHHRAGPVDVVVALNFSYYALRSRERLLAWLTAAWSQLGPDGLLVLDVLGGPSCYQLGEDPPELREGFTYIWETLDFDPIGHRARCAIHFILDDGQELRRAFQYDWRLWTMPELRDAVRDAGFRRSTVWWEGIDPETNEGDGRFAARETAEPLECFVCYLVAQP